MSSQEYFATVAGDWDRLRAGFFPDAVRHTALNIARVRPGQTAADLGAGTGFVTKALLDAGLTVFAVDQSPAMLAELRSRFGPSARLTALEGQAQALPLPGASMDFAFANMFLHHVDDPAQAIREMARILKPGGRLVITDLDSHDHGFLRTEHHDRWPGFARADVAAWFRAAGLESVDVDCAGQDCCADSCAGDASAKISIFAASGLKPVLGLRPADVEPLAVGRRAQALWSAEQPLLCAEAVFQAVAEALGVDSPLVPRLATGFCSGLSRTCGPCGAFSAGIMALGLALGRDTGADDLDRTYVPAQEYGDWFLERFGALNCQELTGHDLGSAQGLAAYREAGLKHRLCGPLLEQAAAQVMRLLAEQ